MTDTYLLTRACLPVTAEDSWNATSDVATAGENLWKPRVPFNVTALENRSPSDSVTHSTFALLTKWGIPRQIDQKNLEITPYISDFD